MSNNDTVILSASNASSIFGVEEPFLERYQKYRQFTQNLIESVVSLGRGKKFYIIPCCMYVLDLRDIF